MENVTPESPKIAIDLMTEDHLKDVPVAELEALLTYMHGMANVLKAKQKMVHDMLEFKQRAEQEEKEAMKANTPEEVDAKIAALQKRKEDLAKPPAQHLLGDHITSDAQENQGQ